MAKLEPSDAELENSLGQLLSVARGESPSKLVDDAWRNEVKSLISQNWSSRSLQTQHLFHEWVVDIATTSNFRVVIDAIFVAHSRSLAPDSPSGQQKYSKF